jgi:hypothetical protein
MPQQRIEQRASRITRFVVVQLIALIGWIIVQSFFSLSLPGRAIPFTVTIVIEAVWWIITLVIMFLLFRREYKSFVQAAVELEDANKRLREATNRVLYEIKTHREPTRHELSDQNDQNAQNGSAATDQDDQTEHVPPIQSTSESGDQSDQAGQEPSDQRDQAEHVSPVQSEQAEHEPQAEHILPVQSEQARHEATNEGERSGHETASG